MRSLSSNPFVVALLCLALLVRVVVPAGFMPDMGALQHGIYKIKICTGLGPQTISVDQTQKQIDGKQDNGKTEKSGSQFCPFAGALGSALPVTALVLALLILWQRLRRSPKDAFVVSAFPAFAWARGPPSFV